jgi:hypothetical protein
MRTVEKPTIMTRTFSRTVTGAAMLLVAACQDLAAPNNNNPDRNRALSSPSDVETLLLSTYRQIYNNTQGDDYPNMTFSAIADEMTTTASNFGAWGYASEPRIAFDNDPTNSFRRNAEDPYYEMYSTLSNVHDGLEQLNNGMKILDASGRDNTIRARAYAKMNQGIAHGLLGMIYDQAFIVTEATDISDPSTLKNLPLVSYKVLRDTAIGELRAAIDLARKNTFSLDDAMSVGTKLSNADLARIAHSWIARILAYTPRTPTDRQAADWKTIIASADSGVTADWGPVGGPNVLTSNYKAYSQYDYTATRIIYYADNRLVGPADISGNYQRWLKTPITDRQRFEITTPDRRITGVGGAKSNGSYFRYLSGTVSQRADRGTYHHSYYQLYRWPGSGGGYYGQISSGVLVSISRAELDLLKAEGLYRSNDLAGAVTLINKSRVNNGKLPPVTTTGVSGADCVPRTEAGACGTLFDALVYEKRIEQAGTDVMAWYDARGFGLLSKGSFLQLPIPGRELSVLGLASYTFGGVGGQSSVP